MKIFKKEKVALIWATFFSLGVVLRSFKQNK
jgi:hypothetical protein